MTEIEYVRTANLWKIKNAQMILSSVLHGEQYGIPKGGELTKAFRILEKLQMSINLNIKEDEENVKDKD